MKLIQVGAAVLNQTPLDWDVNKRNILDAIEQARAENTSILCLPEMCITGYGCEDAYHSTGLRETALEVLTELVPATTGMAVSFGLPIAHKNGVYNAAALVADGRILGFVCKRFLAGDGIHYEPRWFKPWPSGVRNQLTIAGNDYPIGDIHFELGGVRIGFEICEDAWVAKRPGGNLSLAAADIILNPSASHFAFAKIEVRKRFVLEGSRAFGVTYVYTNLLGNEAGRIIYDGGALIASGGELKAVGPRLSYRDVLVTSVPVDIHATRAAQSRLAAYTPNLEAAEEGLVRAPFDYPALEPVWREPTSEVWENTPHIKEEEFARTVTLALFDYLRKSRSGGFVVSLSGGADSAAVTCLCAMMVEFGVRELGLDRFKEKLNYLPDIARATTAAEIIKALVTTAYQSTRNSGDIPRSAAAAVAEAVGARHFELDVDSLVNGYIDLISSAIGRKLSWETDDRTLQNIQARTRAPSVWMLANLKNALLLSTSNRSEAAVGYATMDGDTCGGLSPIAGIDKAFLRQWLKWLESSGPIGLHPIPALRAINDQAPTAELRPPEANQTDEDDLMPYEVLDVVERLAIRDKRIPLEVFRLARARFPQRSEAQLAFWVERFFRLWCQNQWKRERYAPSFHLDDENLDPKTWCRFPILSGGFTRELEELRRHVGPGAE